MKLEFKISEEDYLTYQLYTASKSENIRRRRFRSKYLISLVYLIFATVFIADKNYLTGIIFSLVAVLWFFFYPSIEKNNFVKSYTKALRQNYKDRLGASTILEIDENTITSTDEEIITQFATGEIENITELETIVFIKLEDGQALVVPRKTIEADSNTIPYLKRLSEMLDFDYILEKNWIWK